MQFICFHFYIKCNGTHTTQTVYQDFHKSLGDHRNVFRQDGDEPSSYFCSYECIWTLTLSEACSFLYSGVFCDPLEKSLLRSWGNFGQPATFGKVYQCFYLLWIMALVVHWRTNVQCLAGSFGLLHFYLSDFFTENRCGSNQAFVWLEKFNLTSQRCDTSQFIYAVPGEAIIFSFSFAFTHVIFV